ncbi:hypothetical protein B0G69_5671 [Paraburkholderia sp. RAU2J]|nr:hypothetical protein B0G69_5671 [Paraburkholderia sp. RAU2J]
MYSISTRHERRLLWLLALTQFTMRFSAGQRVST